MPTFVPDGKNIATFVLNHVIAHFDVPQAPQAIIIDHGIHFQNIMMTEFSDQLGLRHDNSTPYYP